MKKLVIIAHSRKTAAFYAEHLMGLLGKSIEFEVYSLDESIPKRIRSDAALLSTHTVYELMEDRLNGCRHILIAELTLRKEALNKLTQLPQNTSAMLVNSTREMAIETIRLIKNAGFRTLELVPAYPGIQKLPDSDIAITPGEVSLVPSSVSQTINLGDRVLSALTIINLAIYLEKEEVLDSHVCQTYFNEILEGDLGLSLLLSSLRNTRNQKVELLEELDQKLNKRRAIRSGYVAKYSFSSIKTQNPYMMKLIETAKRMAVSSSSVVIYGPSGTGKELFAQSIHNASGRRDFPFIALNCASIPENLLESELFGYSDGAFTGAKRGGKAGYFELAHHGTLFLDEIGEMALSLQARLLRVLQEKEIIRIGGNRVIPVDVRVISATNKNLKNQVQKGLFREDLYYRLNVLSLELPRLCLRNEDIELLITAFQREMQTDFCLTKDALQYLQVYQWPGNVRELRNFVERLSCLNLKTVSKEEAMVWLGVHEEIPETKTESPNTLCNLSSTSGDLRHCLEALFLREQKRKDILKAILHFLYDNDRFGKSMGRGELRRCLQEMGIVCTEREMRTCLQILNTYGLTVSHRGRGGTSLSEFVRSGLTEHKLI